MLPTGRLVRENKRAPQGRCPSLSFLIRKRRRVSGMAAPCRAASDRHDAEREGVGRLRVVDDCRLHHVAILPRSATAKPVYTGARCYGVKGNGIACPSQLSREARLWAFRFIKEQAGCRV